MPHPIRVILTSALAKIEKGFTKFALARDSAGRSVDYDSKNAVCFCSLGAFGAAKEEHAFGVLNRRFSHDEIREIRSITNAAQRLLAAEMGGDIVAFNDERTHTEVVAAFKAAIAKAPK